MIAATSHRVNQNRRQSDVARQSNGRNERPKSGADLCASGARNPRVALHQRRTHRNNAHAHPFYVLSRGFTPAGELGIGTSIVTRAGPCAVLASTEVRDAPVTVYNFEVENTHTYFVGHSDLWVHNACRFAASFVKHLVGGDGFVFGRQISGCHNLQEFLNFASANGVKIVKQYDLPIRGLKQVQYEGFALKNGVQVPKIWTKTLYDPKWISDGKMIAFVKAAYEDSVANGLWVNAQNGSKRWWGFAEIDGKKVYFQGYTQVENGVDVVKTGFPKY